MCKHCQRIVEDVQHKDQIHTLMTETAKRIGEKVGYPELTADDLELEFTIAGKEVIRNIRERAGLPQDAGPTQAQIRVYRLLMEMGVAGSGGI